MEVMRLLLEKGATVNATDDNGQTPLHWAASRGMIEVMKLLLEREAFINAKDNVGETPLLKAVMADKKDAVELLLSNGAELGARDKWGDPELNCAAYRGNEEIAGMLLQQEGADIAAPNVNGWTPFLWSAYSGSIEVGKLLLQYDVDLIGAVDNDGWTALHIAATEGNTDFVGWLLEKSANIGKMNQHEWRNRINPNARDNNEQTPLHFAAQRGHKSTVEFLIERSSADTLEAKDCAGNTALHLASGAGKEDVVGVLLKKMSRDSIAGINHAGQTALSLAADAGKSAVVRLLVEYQADVPSDPEAEFPAMERTNPKQVGSIAEFLLENDKLYKDSPDMREKTLHWAARNGNTKFMENLLSQEKVTCDIGRTLFWAAVGGQESAVQWLLDEFTEGDPSCVLQKKDKIKAVQAAAHNGHEKVVQQLLSHMMDSQEDTKSWTALHWAVNWTEPEAVFVVKHLLMNGANPEATNGDTPDAISAVEMAKKLRQEGEGAVKDIVDLLESPLRLLRKPLPLTVPDTDGLPDICEHFRCNIIDFYSQDNRFYTLERKSPVSDVVYGEGPEKVMPKARRIWENEWKDKPAQRFRWIHLPVNNWIWAEDLMRMVLCDSRKSDGDYTSLKNFVEQNRHEHLGPPQCRFMYPALRFETKDFRSGEGSSIARLQGKSAQDRDKDRKQKINTKPSQDDKVTPEGEVAKDPALKPMGSHRLIRRTNEVGEQNIPATESEPGGFPNNLGVEEPKDFDRKEGQVDVKQQQQGQKDGKEKVPDSEGTTSLGDANWRFTCRFSHSKQWTARGSCGRRSCLVKYTRNGLEKGNQSVQMA
ncbi:hypothetical protein VTN77DRAFT_3431 [Rasamsonia byssochlamydoides]|uniref:uncharacterized protein n=1 Tax=Rasamsonia byssochlamydoides TaxID=89139 RepID=UPI0037439FBA